VFIGTKGEKRLKMERRFIGVKELAVYLGIKVDTVYAWVSARRIPFRKLGKLVKFDLKEVDLWVDRMIVKPHMEISL
jgi:excisionase family DNA binding protein